MHEARRDGGVAEARRSLLESNRLMAAVARPRRARRVDDKKRGRKPADTHPLVAKLAASEKFVAALTRKLEKAQEIIDVQKKIAELFGRVIKLPEHLEEIS